MRIDIRNNPEEYTHYPYLAMTTRDVLVLVADDGYIYLENGVFIEWEQSEDKEEDLTKLPGGTQVTLTQTI